MRIVGRPSNPVTRLLKPGNTGQDVVTLQQALAEKGYDVGLADARYGEQTASAVKQLQEDYGLYPDGLGWPDVYSLLGGEVGCRAGWYGLLWQCWWRPLWDSGGWQLVRWYYPLITLDPEAEIDPERNYTINVWVERGRGLVKIPALEAEFWSQVTSGFRSRYPNTEIVLAGSISTGLGKKNGGGSR